ncbi:Uncharacterized protein dnm_007880 [Desulfonema magnum]|uniref:Uncharacterized protein n=1 Tax=Desulfonema magnum TaxID=45655 RepID=A0A975BGC0_9BACT|nr:Uncharacterized protein dnm_007880 [Desulfonema magnum]
MIKFYDPIIRPGQPVVPEKAGITDITVPGQWIPAFAGMTNCPMSWFRGCGFLLSQE